MRLCVGVDWGGDAHAVCVVDARGTVAARFEVAHTAEGLAELARRLAQFGPPAGLPVAIERPSGLLVDALLAAGHPVVPIHPEVVKASRPRYQGNRSNSVGYRQGADLSSSKKHTGRVTRLQRGVSGAVFALQVVLGAPKRAKPGCIFLRAIALGAGVMPS